MNERSNFLATKKSDDELYYCIDNREKFLPETVEAAVAELKARGAEFSEQELVIIAEDMQARRELASELSNEGRFGFNQKDLQVEDLEAPLLYSKRVIWVFAVLFSVLFGSIMMAMNVYNTKNRSKALLIVLYGAAFTTATILIGQRYVLNSGFTIAFSIIGAAIMESLFWRGYIGNTTLYRPRSYTVPLIIALGIVTLVVLSIIIGNQ